MNDFDRIIDRFKTIERYGESDITEIKPILEKYNNEDLVNELNSVDKHKLIGCREIYLAIALNNNEDKNYIFHESNFIFEQIQSIIREKENLKHKDSSDSYYKKGLIMKWLNKHRESIVCFTDALRYIDKYNINSQTIVKPDHGKNELKCHIHFERGNMFLNLGECNLAIKDYNEIVKMESDYTRVYKSLGFSYTLIGYFDKAKECFDKYVPEPDTSVTPINIDYISYRVNNVPCFVIESMKKANYWISNSVQCEHEIDEDGRLCIGSLMITPQQ